MPNLKKSDARDVYVAGLKMSNWLYNMAQYSAFESHKKIMQEMVKEWDTHSLKLYPKKKAGPQ